MTIDVKGGSGLIWQQDSETKREVISGVTSATYVTAFTISEECLATNLYVNAGPSTTGSMRVTKNGVLLAEVSTTGGASSQGFNCVIGQYVNGQLTGEDVENLYQPPSPPLHCTQSLLVEIKRDSGTGNVGAILQYTTGTFEPI